MPYASPSASGGRKTTVDITQHKHAAPIAALTAYTAPMARLLDAHADLLLVGDSLGMVVYGMESTLPVTLEMMIAHGRAVVEASASACVIVDMPFGSYQGSPEAAFNAAARVMAETGAQGIKIEGGEVMKQTIAFLTARAIPVVGHVGLMPQYVHVMGGYKYQGRELAARKQILKDARAVQEAGAFAIVLEGVEESLAREITDALIIPTIGIGASSACDGQVLVVDDMLGITASPPKFVKQYAQLGSEIEKAAAAYAKDVRARKFPEAKHCFMRKEK